jgi:ribosomal protein S18 acetylase RimI-like enzyme
VLAKRDLGSRVVVRRRVGRQFTDLLGELTELSGTHLTIMTLKGPVRVPLDEVHRAKRVPDIAGIERAAAEAMPALHTSHLGDWLLRASAGYTGRANSVLPLGDPGMPFSQALKEIAAFYARHNLPPLFDVPLPLGRPVARALADHDYRPLVTVQVMAADLPDLIEATPAGPGFDHFQAPSPQMLAMISGRRGPLPPAAHHVLTQVPIITFIGHAPHGELLAMARGTVTRNWLGIFHVETAPSARRQGLARAAVGELVRWARTHGARRAYLQVQDDNTPAIALYRALGFTAHHTYTRYGLTPSKG